MMAAAGRESHRSPSAEKNLLSPPVRVSLNNEEDGRRSSSETNVESVVDGGPAAGVAGLEADVGNIDVFFDATPGQQQYRGEAKKLPMDGRGEGGRKNKSNSRGRRPPAAATAAPTAASGPHVAAATIAVDNAVRVTGGKIGDKANAKDLATMEAAKKVSTRERTQQMYETHRQTQEKLKNMRDETATSGCTFSPHLSAKQKSRKSGKEIDAPDHLYQDFQKRLEKREQLVEEERKKISFRPVLPTASSRLAAKIAATVPAVDGHKRAEGKSKATADAMYKECTFAPNTVVTKALTEKILAAKGKQVAVADRLYTSAEAQAALLKSREEAKVAKELAACTFRPDTSGSSKRSSTGSGRGDSATAHERLFGLHGELLMSKQAKREELVARELMECTFSPALVAKPVLSSTSDSNKGAGKASTDTDAAEEEGAGAEITESAHERLYKQRVRAEARVESLDSECTFQPDLALTNKSLASARYREKTEDEGELRVEVMYKHGRQRQAERSQSPRNYTAKFREDDESKEMELCTFQPNVSSTQAGRFKTEPRGRALFATLYGQRGDRDQARERVRKEEMKACTFSPELSSQKTRLGRSLSPQRERPVYEELYHEAATQRLARTMSAEYLQSQECPFKPRLATARSRISPAATTSATKAPVGERRHASPAAAAASVPSSHDLRATTATDTDTAAATTTATSTATTAAAVADTFTGGDGGPTVAQRQPLDIRCDDTMLATASAAAAATASGTGGAAETVLGGERGAPVIPPPAPVAASLSSLSSSATPRKSAGKARGKKGNKGQPGVEVGGSPREASKVTSGVKKKTVAKVATATAVAKATTGRKLVSTKTEFPASAPTPGGGVETASPPPPTPSKEQEKEDHGVGEEDEEYDY